MVKMTQSKCESCDQKSSCKDREEGKLKSHLCAVERMDKIKHKILIASGKGGVGKSTVSVNLARALKIMGYSVGLLDADITGPNIPKLLGIEDQRMMPGPVALSLAMQMASKLHLWHCYSLAAILQWYGAAQRRWQL